MEALYPRGRYYKADLTNTAVTVFSDGRHAKRAYIYGGAAAEIVIFRAVADTPVYMQVPVAIGGFVVVDLDMFMEGGLEVLTASAAGDVGITVTYVQP